MKSFQSLIVMLAALVMINTSMVAGSSSSDVAEQQLSQLEQIQIGSEDERKRILAKPHNPNTTGGGSSSGGSSSGGSSGGGSSSGGSSSGGSAGGGSGGASANGAESSDLLSQQKAKKSLVLMLSIAGVAAMAIAAVAIPRRKVATENAHPLTGSLNRRIGLFSNLAKHAASRPPRRDEEGRYINADSIV